MTSSWDMCDDGTVFTRKENGNHATARSQLWNEEENDGFVGWLYCWHNLGYLVSFQSNCFVVGIFYIFFVWFCWIFCCYVVCCNLFFLLKQRSVERSTLNERPRIRRFPFWCSCIVNVYKETKELCIYLFHPQRVGNCSQHQWVEYCQKYCLPLSRK